MVFRFQGGVRVPHHKALTEKKLVEDLPMPERLIVPVSQHIGAPAKAEVKRKDEVKKGQILSRAGGFVSAHVHAPTSGTVAAVEERPNPVSGKALSIVLEPDGKDEWLEGLPTAERDPQTATPDEIRQAVQAAGIVGMGGAAFPTHVKLAPPKDKPIDAVLINGAECEPYLTSDHAAMKLRPDDMLLGARLIMKAVGAARLVIGVEDNKPDVLRDLEKRTAADPDISVAALPSRYPQGAERSLIHAVLGRKLPAGKLPMDVGVVVQNVNTAIAVSDAVRFGLPAVDTLITVTGSAVRDPKNVRVPVGARFEDVLAFCGGFASEPAKIIYGGPMMGFAQYSLDVPVTKSGSGILCLGAGDLDRRPLQACVRCGRCLTVCPMGLVPTRIAELVEARDFDGAEEAHALDCVECGCCTFECPSRRPLVHAIRTAKLVIRDRMRKRA